MNNLVSVGRRSRSRQEKKDKKLSGDDWKPLENNNKKSKKLTEYLNS